MQENITLRAASLISFYLSKEYQTLRDVFLSSPKISNQPPTASSDLSTSPIDSPIESQISTSEPVVQDRPESTSRTDEKDNND